MKRRKRLRSRRPPHRTGAAPPPPKGEYLLDFFRLSDVRRWRSKAREILTFYWDYYSALLHQRSGIAGEIREALSMAIDGPCRFDKWQRVVDYCYSLEPLSARGSVVTDPGGRFNIGDIAPEKLPPFPALYLAEDVDTALFERFAAPNEKTEGLTALDLALEREESIALLSVSGELDAVIDVCDEKRLEPFVSVISKVKVPP